jgi:hypothetical protein
VPPALDEPAAPPVAESPAPPAERGPRLGAGVRAGVALRFPSVDPSFAVTGVLAGYALQPLVLGGVTLSPGPGVFATEVPLAAGLQLPLTVGRFVLVPEALLGARLHFYGASSLDDGGARVDLLGGLAMSAFLTVLQTLRLGLRVGVELSTAREHRAGSDLLWSRGPAALTLHVVAERW